MAIELQTNVDLMAMPSQDAHVVNVKYVKDFFSGIIRAPVRVVSTVNEPVTHHPGPTHELRYTVAGVRQIDGVTLVVGNRVLIAGQTNAVQNGIYDVINAGTPNAILRRSDDFDNSSKISTGVTTSVSEGTLNAGTTWQMNTAGTIVLDTTALNWIEVTPDRSARLFAHDIDGDNTTTSFPMTHNFNTEDVQIQMWNKANHNMVLADFRVASVNVVNVDFDTAPASGRHYRVVITG